MPQILRFTLLVAATTSLARATPPSNDYELLFADSSANPSSATFEAVGDVTVAAKELKLRKPAKSVKYVGTLRDVRIHNRALANAEIKISSLAQ